MFATKLTFHSFGSAILLWGQINLRKQDEKGAWIAFAYCMDFVTLPGTGFREKKMCLCPQRHTVRCKGMSVSLDLFMLSADPKSISKIQVKRKE